MQTTAKPASPLPDPAADVAGSEVEMGVHLESVEDWVGWFVALLMAVISFFLARHIKSVDGHETRLRALEVKVPELATKDGLDNVRKELSSKVDSLGKSMERQHEQLLGAILNQRDPR